MLAIESSIARVEAALARVSKRTLAAAAGIPRSSLLTACTPHWNPTRRTLEALERAIERGLPTAECDVDQQRGKSAARRAA